MLIHCIHQLILHVSDIRCEQNLVAEKTSRSSLVSDFLLRQDFNATFTKHLYCRKVYELSSNPAFVCWLRSKLCFSSARGWQTTLAGSNAVSSRGEQLNYT